jgi:hypothetical protein
MGGSAAKLKEVPARESEKQERPIKRVDSKTKSFPRKRIENNKA